MLREDITTEPRSNFDVPAKAVRLFVCFGGSDPDDLTSRAMAALRDPRLADIEATVVIGVANPKAADIVTRAPAHVSAVINPANLPALMAKANVAVAGSGTMAWELAYYGVPSILVVHSRGNVVDALTSTGAARSLGDAGLVTSDMIATAIAALIDDRQARSAMCAAGRALVDGRGAIRVADALEKIAR